MKQYIRNTIKSVPAVYRAINRVRGWRMHDAEHPMPTIELGGDGGVHNYGAWAIPASLHLDAGSIVYSAGIGFDISFDRALIERFGCVVNACDPGDAVAEFVRQQHLSPEFLFEQVALGTTDGNIGYTPLGPSGGVSALVAAESTETFFLPTKTLRTLMNQRGHKRIDLLKMDIEGAEYDVVDHMITEGILPDCILVEFHHLQLNMHKRTRASVERLKAVGYRNFWVSDLGAEYGFLRS